MDSNCATVALMEPNSILYDLATPGTAAQRQLRVLLVEDDPDAAVLAMTILVADRHDPFDVEWVSSLWEAMLRLEEPGIDVILLDLGLPELTGYRSFRAIEAAAAHLIPVVVLTADERADVRRLILDFGACDYLVKHYVKPEQLRAALRRAAQKGWPTHA